MKTKTYLARSDTDAQGLHDGTVMEIVIRIKPQPVLPPGFTLQVPGPLSTRAIPVCWDCAAAGVPNETPYPQLWPIEQAIPTPYQPGDRIAVKEWWTTIPVGNGDTMGYAYRADGESAFDDLADGWDFMDEWTSPSEAFGEAVRTHLLCESVEAREIDDKWCWIVKVKKEP